MVRILSTFHCHWNNVICREAFSEKGIVQPIICNLPFPEEILFTHVIARCLHASDLTGIECESKWAQKCAMKWHDENEEKNSAAKVRLDFLVLNS